MTSTLYGICHCDTVKKARGWLDARAVSYAFHDYKIAGVEAVALNRWIERLGWEALLNRVGTTFRKLPDADKAGLDSARAASIMLAHPSAIRRPVLEKGDTLLVGFRPDDYAAMLNR